MLGSFAADWEAVLECPRAAAMAVLAAAVVRVEARRGILLGPWPFVGDAMVVFEPPVSLSVVAFVFERVTRVGRCSDAAVRDAATALELRDTLRVPTGLRLRAGKTSLVSSSSDIGATRFAVGVFRG